MAFQTQFTKKINKYWAIGLILSWSSFCIIHVSIISKSQNPPPPLTSSLPTVLFTEVTIGNPRGLVNHHWRTWPNVTNLLQFVCKMYKTKIISSSKKKHTHTHTMQELIRAQIQKHKRHFCLNQDMKAYRHRGPLIILINTHSSVTTLSYNFNSQPKLGTYPQSPQVGLNWSVLS